LPTQLLTRIVWRIDLSPLSSPRSSLASWPGSTSSSDMDLLGVLSLEAPADLTFEAPARKVVLDWRQQLWHRYDSFRGTKLLKSHVMVFKSYRHSLLARMEYSTKVVRSEKKRQLDKMLCEQEKCATLTKNKIARWSEDSYRGRGRVGNSCR